MTRAAERSEPPVLTAADPEVPMARLLAMAYRHLVVELHERLQARGWHDVRPQYGYVLLACRDQPTTSVEVAALLGVSKQAAAKLAEAMVGAGLVRRTRSDLDARARPLTLTARGRRLLAVVEEVYAELEAGWADAIGRSRVKAVRSGLTDVLVSAYDGALPPVRPI
ncbi:MAG TPA: MarR family transcriptional regulator [Actinomycetes bacterium]